jgi:hypothetical protein
MLRLVVLGRVTPSTKVTGDRGKKHCSAFCVQYTEFPDVSFSLRTGDNFATEKTRL